jgi:predicted nucleic acid-binding protein
MLGKRRVVADTNVIISAMGWEGNEKRILEKALSGEIILIESNSMMEELEDVLSR